MKKEYNIKDNVWIHLGERKLVEGRVVEIIDLVHLKEGHSPDRELYVIEIKTGIDDIYEVRDFDQISPDAKGPIGLFRKFNLKQVQENSRYLKKVGMALPVDMPNPLVELAKEINEELDTDGPSAEEIHAALDQSLKSTEHAPLNLKAGNQKRRYFKKKPKA
jgi:hypothetical protein